MNQNAVPFTYAEDPDLPDWHRWRFRDATRFNAFLEPLHLRVEGEIARARRLRLADKLFSARAGRGE